MKVFILTFFARIVGFLKFYLVLLTLRIYITWFPNINNYTQPFSTLGKMTDFYLRVFRGLVPAIFGIDLSPILGFLFINFLIDFFSSVTNFG